MFTEIDGINTCYKISGEGDRTAVVLQGWGTDMSVYDSVAAALSPEYRVIQLDLPGFGKSDEPGEAWNVDRYAGFFCRFMEKKGGAYRTFLRRKDNNKAPFREGAALYDRQGGPYGQRGSAAGEDSYAEDKDKTV